MFRLRLQPCTPEIEVCFIYHDSTGKLYVLIVFFFLRFNNCCSYTRMSAVRHAVDKKNMLIAHKSCIYFIYYQYNYMLKFKIRLCLDLSILFFYCNFTIDRGKQYAIVCIFCQFPVHAYIKHSFRYLYTSTYGII